MMPRFVLRSMLVPARPGPKGITALAVALGALTVTALVSGCVSDRPTEAAPPVVGDAVTIENFAYSPPTLSAQTGTIVRWTNNDDVAHTVTADDDTSFDSGAFAKGATFEFTAGPPGTYAYACQIHPFMQGTLIVTP